MRICVNTEVITVVDTVTICVRSLYAQTDNIVVQRGQQFSDTFRVFTRRRRTGGRGRRSGRGTRRGARMRHFGVCCVAGDSGNQRGKSRLKDTTRRDGTFLLLSLSGDFRR